MSNVKRITVVAMYENDWQWALISEFALREKSKNQAIEILDLTGTGTKNLRDVVRFYFRQGKFSHHASKQFASRGIKVIRKMPNLIPSTSHLLGHSKANQFISESIKSSVKDKIKKEIPKTRSDQKTYKKEYRNAFYFHKAISKFKWGKDNKYIIVNGRFSKCKILTDFLRSQNLEVHLLEFGHSPQTLQIFENSPHNLAEHEKVMQDLWKSANLDSRVQIAERYFRKMKVEDPVAGVNWTEKMKVGKLPENFDENEKNIVFFTSSNLELFDLFYGIEKPEFSNQYKAFNGLMEIFRPLGWRIYIRMHPQSSGSEKERHDDSIWHEFSEDSSVTVIRGESNVDSFALAHKCELVAHFNSSIGPQLIWEGHQGVLTLGPTFWKALYPSRHFSNSHSLSDFVHEQSWLGASESSHSVYAWAFYRATRGSKFKFIDYNEVDKKWSFFK